MTRRFLTLMATTALFTAAGSAFAQAPADDCGSAPTISVGDFPFDVTGATTDGTSSCGFNTQNDLWYDFVPTADGRVTVSTCDPSRTFDTVLAAFASCGGAQLACNDDTCGLGSTISFVVTNGSHNLIRIAGYNGAVGQSVLHVSFVPSGGGGGTNDDCGSATHVGEGDFPIDTTTATNDGTGSCGASGASPDIWFDFLATRSGFGTFTLCDPARTYDTAMSVFDSCGGLELACNDDTGSDCGLGSTINLTVTAGTHYFVRVAGFAGNTGTSVLHISVIEGGPANDNCDAATAVGEGDFPIDTRGATDDGSASCAATSNSDVWYNYTASQTGAARVNSTGTTFNTVVSAYDSCGGAELGCATFGAIVQFPTVAGGHYVIRVGGNGAAAGTGTLHIENIIPPANDHCQNAIAAVEGDNDFNNVGADTDGTASCTFGDTGTHDVWYTFRAPRSGLMTITTCPGGLDTVLTVFDSCGGAEIACNDATANGGCARVFLSATANTNYVIRLATHFTAEGSGTMNISIGDFPAPCVTRPSGALDETELCGEDTDGGCNDPNTATQAIPSTAVIFGTAFADNNLRDTDWYLMTLDHRSEVTVTMESEFNGFFFVIGDCNAFNTIAQGNSTACAGPATFTTTLAAGSYLVFAAHGNFWDSPCLLAGQSHYVLTVTSNAVGACCTGGACSVTTEAACTSGGGTWSGADTNCGTTTYTAAASNNAFEDISSTGTNTGLQQDDATIAADIGFDFSFFGVTYNSCHISSNGNIQFGDSDSAAFFNDNSPIPTAGVPDNMIAPAWDDYDLRNVGSLYTLTDGTAPNRRFVVSWQGVTQFGLITPDSNSFQAILYEGTNAIEFRYGEMAIRGAANDITVGVENADGTDGLNMDGGAIGAGNNAQLLTGVSTGSPCDNNPCAGADFNHADGINADDLSDFITCYFQAVVSPAACPAADFNHADGINADDLSDFITTYFSCV